MITAETCFQLHRWRTETEHESKILGSSPSLMCIRAVKFCGDWWIWERSCVPVQHSRRQWVIASINLLPATARRRRTVAELSCADCGLIELRTQIRRIFLDPQIDGGYLAEEISGRGLTRILFPDECNIFWWAALSAKALSKPWLISIFYSHTRLLSSCMPLFL